MAIEGTNGSTQQKKMARKTLNNGTYLYVKIIMKRERGFLRRLTVLIGRCFNSGQKLHIANIVNIDLIFQNYNQAFTVQFHCQNRCRKCKLAYRGFSLLNYSY